MAFNSFGKNVEHSGSSLLKRLARLVNQEADFVSEAVVLNESPVDISDLKQDYVDPLHGRRAAPRFALNLEVVLMGSSKSYRSSTLNISASGALLAEVVPCEFAREPFEVMLVANGPRGQKQRFLFRAKVVGSPLRSARLHFLKSLGGSVQRLNELIEQAAPLAV